MTTVTITTTDPAKDVENQPFELRIDLAAQTMIVGQCTITISDASIASLKKDMDAELPKNPKYKSHSVVTSP